MQLRSRVVSTSSAEWARQRAATVLSAKEGVLAARRASHSARMDGDTTMTAPVSRVKTPVSGWLALECCGPARLLCAGALRSSPRSVRLISVILSLVPRSWAVLPHPVPTCSRRRSPTRPRLACTASSLPCGAPTCSLSARRGRATPTARTRAGASGRGWTARTRAI